jgi:hypothetical protein
MTLDEDVSDEARRLTAARALTRSRPHPRGQQSMTEVNPFDGLKDAAIRAHTHGVTADRERLMAKWAPAPEPDDDTGATWAASLPHETAEARALRARLVRWFRSHGRTALFWVRDVELDGHEAAARLEAGDTLRDYVISEGRGGRFLSKADYTEREGYRTGAGL